MISKGNNCKRNTDSATRAQLIRKGNEFFNAKHYASAEKIFVTVDYKDGITRLGDYYFDKGDMYNAARLYYMSENQKKIDFFCEKAANVISKLIHDDDKNDNLDNSSCNEANKILKIY